MIPTVFRIAWLNLTRDRVALALTFLLPIAFFTIFALIFGSPGPRGPTESRPLDVIVVDEDRTGVSARLLEALEAREGLAVTRRLPGDDQAPPAGTLPTRDDARRAVRSGEFEAAVVIPAGFGQAFGNFGEPSPAVEVIYDPANPVAEFAVSGLLQASAFTAAPDVLLDKGIDLLEDAGGFLTDSQRRLLDSARAALEDGARVAREGDSQEEGFTGLVTVKSINVRSLDPGEPSDGPNANSMIAYYAAGMGVMFLLFSMTGAAGSLLEEEESGALERLLTSRASLSEILAGKWLFFAGLGVAQVTLMFIYGSVVFDLPLWTPNHLAGFAVVTTVTALAASAFGLLLATLCRSRAQLGGLSTIVILIMSAVGGSMVPRFIMPDFMETLGRLTFNGWAMDAFLAVFWNDDPGAGVLESLAPLALPVGVMAAMTAVFLVIARLSARRWETA
ncbi:MAG: ABC transporter permease [Gammaproteobacteria bacterium]